MTARTEFVVALVGGLGLSVTLLWLVWYVAGRVPRRRRPTLEDELAHVAHVDAWLRAREAPLQDRPIAGHDTGGPGGCCGIGQDGGPGQDRGPGRPQPRSRAQARKRRSGS